MQTLCVRMNAVGEFAQRLWEVACQQVMPNYTSSSWIRCEGCRNIRKTTDCSQCGCYYQPPPLAHKGSPPFRVAGESSLSLMDWHLVVGVFLPCTQCMLGETIFNNACFISHFNKPSLTSSCSHSSGIHPEHPSISLIAPIRPLRSTFWGGWQSKGFRCQEDIWQEHI